MKKLSPKEKTIHDQFSKYGKNAKEWMNKCILLLPQIEKKQIWQKKGFSSIYEYAAKIAGMSRNKVNESLRILKKTENLPAIRRVIESKGIFAVKPVVNIATTETDRLWAKKASEMKKSTLETFVKDYRKEQENHLNNQHIKYTHDDTANTQIGTNTIGRPGAGSPTSDGFNKPNPPGEDVRDKNSDSRIQVSMKLEPEILQRLKKIKGDDEWNFIMEKMLKCYQKELEIEQKRNEAKEKQFQAELKQEKPKAVKSSNHIITTAIKKYIYKRSKGMCEHPHCQKPGKHIHHTEPFSLKKIHDPDKLVFLCEEHHQIIHLGYIDDTNLETKTGQSEQFAKSYPSKHIQSVGPIISWKQIEKLPVYDLKNVINQNIANFRKSYQ